STPLGHQRVREAAYGEILRLIKEEEPPRPSTRLSESGAALASISAQRHMEPAQLTRMVRGELDWIVMKTLEKDRNRRYETANGSAAAAERQARLAAQKAEQAARESAADTKAYGEFLVNDVLSIARPAGERGGLGIHVTVRQALEAAQEKISATFQDRPRAEAVARHDLGVTLVLIGERQQAEPHLRRAVALRKQLLGPDHEDTLNSQNSLAVLLVALGKREEALPLLEETLRLRKATLGRDHPRTLESMNNLAHCHWSAGKVDLALPLFEETLKLTKAILGPNHRDTLSAMNNLASSYQDARKLDLAVPLFEETLKLTKDKLGPDHPHT